MNADNIAKNRKEGRIKEFLEQGSEDASVTSWRMFRIIAELVSGFELLRKYGLAATLYGSARAESDSWEFAQAEKLARLLSGEGFAIISGGGNGIMRAANKGAYESGGVSIGLNIKLPAEQHLNHFVTESYTFNFFFTRKVALAFASEIYVFFPGGFGTLDEFFEIITLVQTHKIDHVPVILVGKEYWTPLLEWMQNSVYEKYHYLGENDMSIMQVVDSAEEAHALVLDLLKK